ncbi:hypothetical protein NG99_26860 [Erwinia typographi]|uniref:Uncharacterized protein n=1 Tax=Erwinia typographi TaxID=371042 RepID=A0A0A3YH77_9GAMM|nr:hypothetical protein [Erwinia typographi]KGT86127.1 hypothetical protein NG99_26860 [Erwinia typographi]
MNTKSLGLLLFILFSSSAGAAMQCGPFNIAPHPDGDIYVNGVRARTQKVTFTDKKGDYNNVKIHLLVKNTKAPGMLSIDQLNHQGKASLKVEVVRTSASQIRLTGSYDCENVG